MNPVLVEAPNLYPGVCIDGRQDACINTFYELPGYGQVYLSRPMLRESAREMPGLVEELAREQGRWLDDELLAEHDATKVKLAAALEKLSELEGVTLAQIHAAFQREKAAA